MSKQPHTEFRKGQRVIVFLENGDQFVGKYVGKFRDGIELEPNVKFKTKKIRQVSIYKEQSEGEKK